MPAITTIRITSNGGAGANQKKGQLDEAAWRRIVKPKVEAGEPMVDGDFENWFVGERGFAPGGANGATAKTLREMSKAKADQKAREQPKAGKKSDDQEYVDAWGKE